MRKEDVRATFFVLGEQVQERPNIAKRIVEEPALGFLPGAVPAYYWERLKTENILQETTGVRPRFIRAPGRTGRFISLFISVTIRSTLQGADAISGARAVWKRDREAYVPRARSSSLPGGPPAFQRGMSGGTAIFAPVPACHVVGGGSRCG
ncbi:polysaccharide deacetylase family protein [Paenibacillus elgii]|uniref:polysaccharide deacetylase family protein n=1 Tax=Paenibacillus elgii TaxID=189691 RepID=UPI001F1F1DD7|nr:polysaccharide deacetylase family protein [Paenibacillus elgii]